MTRMLKTAARICDASVRDRHIAAASDPHAVLW